METILEVIFVWVFLGIHSCYYLVKHFTKEWEFTTSDIWMLILCLMLPIVTHIMTYIVYVHPKKEYKPPKVLWGKKEK